MNFVVQNFSSYILQELDAKLNFNVKLPVSALSSLSIGTPNLIILSLHLPYTGVNMKTIPHTNAKTMDRMERYNFGNRNMSQFFVCTMFWSFKILRNISITIEIKQTTILPDIKSKNCVFKDWNYSQLPHFAIKLLISF